MLDLTQLRRLTIGYGRNRVASANDRETCLLADHGDLMHETKETRQEMNRLGTRLAIQLWPDYEDEEEEEVEDVVMVRRVLSAASQSLQLIELDWWSNEVFAAPIRLPALKQLYFIADATNHVEQFARWLAQCTSDCCPALTSLFLRLNPDQKQIDLVTKALATSNLTLGQMNIIIGDGGGAADSGIRLLDLMRSVLYDASDSANLVPYPLSLNINLTEHQSMKDIDNVINLLKRLQEDEVSRDTMAVVILRSSRKEPVIYHF